MGSCFNPDLAQQRLREQLQEVFEAVHSAFPSGGGPEVDALAREQLIPVMGDDIPDEWLQSLRDGKALRIPTSTEQTGDATGEG